MEDQRVAATLSELTAELDAMLARGESFDRVMFRLVQRLHCKNTRFRWVGIYEADGAGCLRLGAFQGSATDHVFVPAGRGVCGEALEFERSVVVPDVEGHRGYLRCSRETRSELAVPILSNHQAHGVIDIESTELDAFSPGLVAQVEELAEWLSGAMERRDLEVHGYVRRVLSA